MSDGTGWDPDPSRPPYTGATGRSSLDAAIGREFRVYLT
jgi:hypothetical protein